MIFISEKCLLKGEKRVNKFKLLLALKKETEREFEALKVKYDNISRLTWDICFTGYTDIIYVLRETNKRI